MRGLVSKVLADAADLCRGDSAATAARDAEVRIKLGELIESSPADIDVNRAFDLLGSLGWPSLWTLLDELGRARMGLETMNQLELLHAASSRHPNLDSRLRAALLVALATAGGRTISRDRAVLLVDLAPLLISLEEDAQLEITTRLTGDADAAEGIIACLMAEAVELGLATLRQLSGPLDADAEDFELATAASLAAAWRGSDAHRKIAEFYERAHMRLPGMHWIRTNTISVSAIVKGLAERELLFTPSHINESLAASKPDIFEWSTAHGMPPGWVYEIKPATLEVLAAAEASWYLGSLTESGVPVVPGPVTAPGTRGRVPAPNGWYDFLAPRPGVIVYQYVKAPKRRVREQASEREQQRVTRKLNQLLVAAHPQAPQVAPQHVVLAAFLAVLTAPLWAL